MATVTAQTTRQIVYRDWLACTWSVIQDNSADVADVLEQLQQVSMLFAMADDDSDSKPELWNQLRLLSAQLAELLA